MRPGDGGAEVYERFDVLWVGHGPCPSGGHAGPDELVCSRAELPVREHQASARRRVVGGPIRIARLAGHGPVAELDAAAEFTVARMQLAKLRSSRGSSSSVTLPGGQDFGGAAAPALALGIAAADGAISCRW